MSLSNAKNRSSSNSRQINSAHWEGPLPPPGIVAQFNDVVQNGAERIFRMAEIEQQHRIESERTALEHNIKTGQIEVSITRIGVTLGGLVSLLSIVACLISVGQGAHWSVSIALVGLPLMGAIRALITRK